MSDYRDSVEIIHDNETGNQLAIIVRASYDVPGVTFFTASDSPMQLGYLNHPRGKNIPAHVHREVRREVTMTQETLVIRKGSLRVDFYRDNSTPIYLSSRLLKAGDVILLISGGHGFYAVEDVEMIEVKQGPYVGGLDKITFQPGLDIS